MKSRLRRKRSRRVHGLRFGILVALTAALAAAPVFGEGQQEQQKEQDTAAGEKEQVTVTLGYNAFLSDSFTDAPPPIDVIRQELEKKYPHIKLKYYTMPSDMLNSLTIWMTSQDSTVDIYGMDTPWVTQFGRGGWAVPLNDKLPQLEENFQESGLDTFTYDGKRLGVPFWGGVSALYYRTDILEKYGYDKPETIEEFVEICRTVKEEEPDMMGFAWPGARRETLVMVYATLLHAFGGEYTDSQGNYAFDSEESIEAVKFLRSMTEEGLSPQTVVNWERAEAEKPFTEGKAVFMWGNQSDITWLDDPEESDIAGKWDFIPFPGTPEGEKAAIPGGFAFSANPYSKHPDATIKVLEVIASRAVQKGFALAWGPVQYYKGLYEDEEVQEYNQNVDKLPPVLEVTKKRPPSKNYAQLSSIIQQGVHGVITGTRSAEDAMTNINNRAENLKKD
jgi:multiple sugar transport system substrate-binding protein